MEKWSWNKMLKISNLSKHLSRLRLTGVVSDVREGLSVYYSLIKPQEKTHKELLNVITSGLSENETFRTDIEKMKLILKETRKNLKSSSLNI